MIQLCVHLKKNKKTFR